MSRAIYSASAEAADDTSRIEHAGRAPTSEVPAVTGRLDPYTLLAAGTVAIACFFSAKLGLDFALPGVPAPALWAPNAILLAALLLSRPKQWWIYLAAAFPAVLSAQIWVPDVSLVQSVLEYLVNAVTALIGAFALNAFARGKNRFDGVRPTAVLLFVCGLATCLFTSVQLAAAFWALGLGRLFWMPVFAQALTEAFAIATLVPLIAHAAAWTRMAHRAVRPLHAIETCLFAISVAALGVTALLSPTDAWPDSAVLLLAAAPLLLWAALRLGVSATCASVLLLGCIAIEQTLDAGGPLTPASPELNLLVLISCIALACAMLMLLAAALEERRSLAGAVMEADAKFGALFSFTGVAAVLWRSDGRVTDANEAFLRLSGFDSNDIAAGRIRVDELTPGYFGHAEADPRAAAKSILRETQLLRQDGTPVPVLMSRGHFGQLGTGAACFLDLSHSRSLELVRKNERLLHSAVLASVHDQIVVIDQSGIVIESNESWRRSAARAAIHAFERAQIGDQYLQSCANAAAAGDTVSRELVEEIRSVIAGSSIRRLLEFSVDSSDGLLWFEMSVEPLRRLEGGVVITRTDITERKQAMLQAREQRQQLTHLGRAAVLGELSGAFAHELNQPLTSILGNAEAALQLLTRESVDLREIRAMLEDIVLDDIRAAEVIQRLRAMLTRGEIQRQPVEISQVVREVLDLARGDLVTRNVTVSTHFDPQALPVFADRVQIQQVVLNLVVNACEAMSGIIPSERKLAISTRYIEKTGIVECSVADRGGGIAADSLERIFQPFVTTKLQGLGLGLAICRSIVEAHGGRLWAENTADRGAVFRFTTRVDA